MAGTTLDKLPPALGLNGSELVWLYQPGGNEVVPWVGVSCTTSQLSNYINGSQQISYSLTTMRQLIIALQSLGLLTTVFDALTSDITNPYNIAWAHCANISINDPFVTGFLQPTIGYTSAQIQGLFNLAGSIPTYSTGTPTMRQLIAAMASEGTLVPVFSALPSDITNTYNIAWSHGNFMPISDSFVTGFLQPTLGYSGSQMQALYTYALTFPQ